MEMNQQLLAMGGIYPRGCPDRPSVMLAECLIEGTSADVEVEARFNQAVEREVLDKAGAPVEQLVVTGHRYCSGQERLEREVRLASLPNRTATIKTAGSEQMELLEGGAPAGSVIWRWEPLHATIEAWTEEIRSGLHRVRVAVANRLEWEQGEAEQSPMRMLCSTQVVVESADAAFASRVAQRETPAPPL
jgi:hypothetical protein